jgi:hypothetical protein
LAGYTDILRHAVLTHLLAASRAPLSGRIA